MTPIVKTLLKKLHKICNTNLAGIVDTEKNLVKVALIQTKNLFSGKVFNEKPLHSAIKKHTITMKD